MATAIVNIDQKKFQLRNQELGKLIESIVVKDADTCLQMKTLQRDIRAELKARHHVLDPFVDQAKQNYDRAKDERAQWIHPLEAMDDQAAEKVKVYDRQEREAAKREQDKINAENARIAREKADAEAKATKEAVEADLKRRVAEIRAMQKRGEIGKREAAKLLKEAGAYAEAAKEQADADAEAAKNAPPPAVTVKPNIPAVAGVPSTIHYKAEVLDGAQIIQAFIDAVRAAVRLGMTNTNTERAAYLRQFIMADAQAIGAEARKVKDSKKMASLIPGCHFYES